MNTKLDGLKILIPESRELDLFASMLEAESATVLRCPLVSILDLEDPTEALAWIDSFIAAPFDDLVLLTGEGLRRLLKLCASDETRLEKFKAALAKTRTITRGPKPARALREIGLAPILAAATPTSLGVLESLEGEDLKGRRIGVQLYPGDGAQHLITSLKERGADVIAITPYRYATQSEAAKVADMIRAIIARDIGMIAFTSTPQIDRLISVARDIGQESAFLSAMKETPIASIGPVVDNVLEAHGLKPTVRPESSFHMKPLVRAIVAWRAA
ncbi:MAG: uroporphyrinogen-III synthase [Parvibaculum sp.]|nr:uroporphyrinogen-III synthase [Parvibaculum sp.]